MDERRSQRKCLNLQPKKLRIVIKTGAVFASCFVTNTYELNGRKVMSRILEDS
jgi:hypothetical protein